MEEKTSMQIVFGDGVKEKLVALGVSVLDDGTISYKGEIATPVAITSTIDLAKFDSLTVSLSEKENTLLFSYMVWPLEHVFLLEVAKNDSGEETLHFYIKEVSQDNEKI
ncbi:MAG: hypothetical protein QG653_579 [Patescibacteria group bacterium]|nr:hypothetical protein [Patescibacteria group bacterium]